MLQGKKTCSANRPASRAHCSLFCSIASTIRPFDVSIPTPDHSLLGRSAVYFVCSFTSSLPFATRIAQFSDQAKLFSNIGPGTPQHPIAYISFPLLRYLLLDVFAYEYFIVPCSFRCQQTGAVASFTDVQKDIRIHF